MGIRTGKPRGRPPGAKSKVTVERELRAASGVEAAIDTGILPLDVMLKRMRGGAEGEKISDAQFQAAVAAAPYVHPRLAATDITSKGEQLGYVIAATPEEPDADAWVSRHAPRTDGSSSGSPRGGRKPH